MSTDHQHPSNPYTWRCTSFQPSEHQWAPRAGHAHPYEQEPDRAARHERCGLGVGSKDLEGLAGARACEGGWSSETPPPDQTANRTAGTRRDDKDFCPYGPVWQTYSGCLLVVTPAVGGSFRTVGPSELQTTR